jgi:glycosyltransferase involved in cell wall biosynthesis
MLVEVARRLQGTDGRLRFALVGNPLVDNNHIYQETVEEPISRFRLAADGYVQVIEQDRPPNEIMNAFDIFALTSLAEGASLVTAEAMAIGLPVVATNVGSLTDIVKPGLNGFLVEVNDTEAMSQSIAKLLDDDLRAVMGGRSREIVEAEVSDERCAEAHLAAYEEVLAAIR